MTRGRARRYLLVKQGYYPGVVASMGYDVWDWSTLNAGTLFQDSAKTTPASANGDVIGCWTDGVGGVDAVQATTANKPTYVTGSLGGLPTLSFDGGDLLATGNISISTFAVWAVVVPSVTGTFVVYEQSVNAVSNSGMVLLLSQMYTRRSAATTRKTFANLDTSAGILRHEYNGTNASHLIYRNNATVSITGNTLTDNPGTDTITDNLYIGARSGVSLPFTGNIAQLTIVSPYPTDASIIANMESYINSKWSVY